MRFMLANSIAVALVAAVWAHGWLDGMIATDKYHLVKLNVSVFLIGLGLCGHRILKLSQDLNELMENALSPALRTNAYQRAAARRDSQSRALMADSLKMKFGFRLGTIRHIANTIVLIGLVGTVIGFIIALSGVNAEAATDAQAIAPMVSTLLLGMAIALYKTLVGSVLNIWLMANYRLLEGGTVHLVAGIIERGVCRRRPSDRADYQHQHLGAAAAVDQGCGAGQRAAVHADRLRQFQPAAEPAQARQVRVVARARQRGDRARLQLPREPGDLHLAAVQ
jgi:MotA/TolQ/ExbB proton channel family protein